MMKKEIMNLINSKEGTYRLNNVSYLKRWTTLNAFNKEVDMLELKFDTINDVCFSIYDTTIKSRDYEGIIKECQIFTERFFNEVASTLCKNLGAGYKNVSKRIC